MTNPKVFSEKSWEKFGDIVNGAQGDPEQFFASVVSFLLPTDPVGNRLKKQFKSGLKSALKKQKKLAEKLLVKKIPKQAKQAVNPLPDISKSSQPILLKSFEKAKKTQQGLIKQYRNGSINYKHIFSEKHIKRGIMNLGKDRKTIVDSFKRIIDTADKKGLLVSGSNQIRTKLNGIDIEVRIFIKNGTVLSIDGFVGDSSRVIQNLIIL